jgi:hypothetical protein
MVLTGCVALAEPGKKLSSGLAGWGVCVNIVVTGR